MLALPDHTAVDVPPNRLSRWSHVQLMFQHLWKCWSHDYLHQLQQRTKWKEVKPNVTIGDLVLVKEDDLPPLVWKKAVIIDMHTGQDGLVRVLTIRTAAGTFIRLIANICVHPKVD